MYQEGHRGTLPDMPYLVISVVCLLVGYRIGVSLERARAFLDAVPSMLSEDDPG
jgi:hypothetical protein